MNEPLATVHLHGPLADRFGARHQFAVRTPSEAVAALDANYPGFVSAFAKHQRYALYVDGEWRDGEAAATAPFAREVHFCPMIEGRAFIGAALVGALFPAIAGTAMATILGGLLFAGLLLGLSFLLTPKVPKPEDTQKDENYAFTGPENVTGQGAAVPLIYGRVYAGSVVISAGLDLGTDQAVTVPDDPGVPPPPTTGIPPGVPAPPGGWPPIVNDRWGRPGPQGWRMIGTTYAIARKEDAQTIADLMPKKVDLWQHPTAKSYYWTRIRGFYYSLGGDAGQWPRESEYERGGHD